MACAEETGSMLITDDKKDVWAGKWIRSRCQIPKGSAIIFRLPAKSCGEIKS
jgi:hypothetical protein